MILFHAKFFGVFYVCISVFSFTVGEGPIVGFSYLTVLISILALLIVATAVLLFLIAVYFMQRKKSNIAQAPSISECMTCRV